jgi:hypothetical protein
LSLSLAVPDDTRTNVRIAANLGKGAPHVINIVELRDALRLFTVLRV